MAFLCPAKLRRRKVSKGRSHDAPLPARITGSASIDTLVRVGLEKDRIDRDYTTPMVVLEYFKPCVEDEIAVRKGDHVLMLYKERDWAYVITEDNVEGFIPANYCAPIGSKLEKSFNENLRLDDKSYTNPQMVQTNTTNEDLGSDCASKQSDSLLNISNPVPFKKETFGRYIVLFCFRPQQEDDISVNRGHFVTVLNKDDPDWFWVQRSDGEEGFVPSTYLCPAEGQTTDSGNGSLGAGPSSIYTAQASISKLPTMKSGEQFEQPQPFFNFDGEFGGQQSELNNNIGKRNLLPSNGLAPFDSSLNTSRSKNFSSTDWQNEWMFNSSQNKDNPVSNGNHVKMLCTQDYTARVPDDLSVSKGEILYADLHNQPAHDWLWAYSTIAKRFGYIPRSQAQLIDSNLSVSTIPKNVQHQPVQTTDPYLSP